MSAIGFKVGVHARNKKGGKHLPHQPKRKQMTSIYESHIDRDEDVDNVVECIEDLAELEWKFPIGTIMDSAQNLPQEVRDGLEKLQQAVGMLVFDGPDILWAFAKAMEITDKVGQRLEKLPYVDSDRSPLVRDLIGQWKQDAKMTNPEPTEVQIRVLQELGDALASNSEGLRGASPTKRWPSDSDMTVQEVRRHVQALVDFGFVSTWLERR